VLVAPLGQVFAVDALGFIVVEIVAHRFLVKPGASFLHCVAGFDPVQVQRVVSHELAPFEMLEKTVTDYATYKPLERGLAMLCVCV
jgi:hypothetical protein